MPYVPLEPPDAPRYELARPREVAFEHHGIRVFHAYKHNYIDNGPLVFWYTLYPDGDFELDIRQLDAWEAINNALQQTEIEPSPSAPYHRVLQHAIETGELKL